MLLPLSLLHSTIIYEGSRKNAAKPQLEQRIRVEQAGKGRAASIPDLVVHETGAVKMMVIIYTPSRQ